MTKDIMCKITYRFKIDVVLLIFFKMCKNIEF